MSGTLSSAMPAALVVAAALTVQAPSAVPVDREPQHRQVYRNDVVALLDVQFPPGYVSLFHTHSNDNVSVRIETGPTRTDIVGGASTEQTAAVGRVVFNSATPPYTHRVANLGRTVIRILDVEILARTPRPTVLAPDEIDGHDVIVDNDRVRISRIVLAPTEHLRSHTHRRGWLDVSVRGWPGAGTFRWQEAGTEVRPVEAGPDGTERVEIEVK